MLKVFLTNPFARKETAIHFFGFFELSTLQKMTTLSS